MPRYLIERSFADGLEIPTSTEGRTTMLDVIANNATEGVTWIHSYVSEDHRKTFCVYDGPSPESLRRAAGLSELPLDTITEVSVLDPYFYVGSVPAVTASAP